MGPSVRGEGICLSFLSVFLIAIFRQVQDTCFPEGNHGILVVCLRESFGPADLPFSEHLRSELVDVFKPLFF